MHRVLTLAAALALLAGPALAASKSAVDEARPTIARANADWLPAMRAGDAERVAEPYAEDGVFVLPNGQTIVGRKAVVELYRKSLSGRRKVLSGDIHQDGLSEAAGGLIIEWGHVGTSSVDAAGKKTTSAGPYMTVWKKGADGRWAIVRNLVF
jgi:uncharacterized protein (TIGR02246 family)